jgi:hypothetical protein
MMRTYGLAEGFAQPRLLNHSYMHDVRGSISTQYAVRDDGFVISVEDRVVFILRSAVLQMELYAASERG